MPQLAPTDVATRVAVVHWPHERAARARARLAGTPRLLVLGPSEPPPTDCALDEDWTSTSAAPADVAARLATLAARPSPVGRFPAPTVAGLDDDAVAVLDVLDRCHPRAAATAALDDAAPGGLAAALRVLRAALAPAGWDVLRVPGGVLLAARP